MDSVKPGSHANYEGIASPRPAGSVSPPLPPKAVSPAALISPSPRAISSVLIVLVWIVLSTAVIMYNRELMVGAPDFHYPITLTTLHLTFQTVATRILHRYTNLIAGIAQHDYSAVPMSDLESAEPRNVTSRADEVRLAKAESVAMSWAEWRTEILPPAVLFSVSLVLSNWAYIYCPVGLLAILKSASPAAIYIAALLFGLRSFSFKIMIIILLICLGVAMASYSKTSVNWIGVTIQMVAIAVEATRVTLISILLQGKEGKKDMSPLKTLYFFAPVCLAMNASLILPLEGFEALEALRKLGLFTIISNATLVFGLNIAAVMLIGISSMALSLSKVIKDIIIVAGSAIVLGEHLSPLQWFGYFLATVMLMVYKFS